MARKSTSGAKKKPAAKALEQELAVARKSSSARRAASGKRATLCEEEHPPATADQASAPTSAPSLVSTSAPTLARCTRTRTGARPLVPAVPSLVSTSAPTSAPSLVSTSAPTSARRTRTRTGDAAPAAADAEVPQDQSPAGTGANPDPELAVEVAILRGMLAVRDQEIQTLRDAAAASPKDYPHIECPAKVGNLQAAMSLKNDDETYALFCVDVAHYAAAAGLSYKTRWPSQDTNKIAKVCNMARDNYPFLKRYICDWPVKEFLKRHFNNQRGYRRRKERERAKEGKTIRARTSQESLDEMWRFDTDIEEGGEGDAGNEEF